MRASVSQINTNKQFNKKNSIILFLHWTTNVEPSNLLSVKLSLSCQIYNWQIDNEFRRLELEWPSRGCVLALHIQYIYSIVTAVDSESRPSKYEQLDAGTRPQKQIFATVVFLYALGNT